MTANDLLLSTIDVALSGDRERVLELFEDASFHSRLAAAPEPGGWLKFREWHGDGFYLVSCASGYEVYYQERGHICADYGRFARIADAAAFFFSTIRWIAPRDVRAHDLGPLPVAPPEQPVGVMEASKTLAMAAFLVVAILMGVGAVLAWLD